MAVRKGRKDAGDAVTFSLKAVTNPVPRSTFGDIGAFYQVRANRKFANELLEIPYKKAAAKNVDESTLRLFWWGKDRRSLQLVEPSGVDVERHVVWGRIGEPGVYGAIGLHRDERVQRTLGILGQLSAQELRAQPELIPPVCGLILCAGPAPLGPGRGGRRLPEGAPTQDLCALCIGLQVPELHLPDVQLLKLVPFRVKDRVPPKVAAPVWPAAHMNYRNTGQSELRGPPSPPSVRWDVSARLSNCSPAVIGRDGTIYRAMWDHIGTSNGELILFALRPRDGAASWELVLESLGRLSGYPFFVQVPAIAPDGTILMSAYTRVCAVSPQGTVQWSKALNTLTSYPMPALDGTVYVRDFDATQTVPHIIYALTPSGAVKWSRQLADLVVDPTLMPFFAVRDDGSVLVPGASQLTALDGSDGHVLWQYAASMPSNWFVTGQSPAVGDDGRIVIRTATGIDVLDSDGQLQRSLPPGPFAISALGTIYVAGPSLRAIDQAGIVLWSRTFSSPLIGTPTIDRDGTVYVLDFSELHALDPLTGADIWKTWLPSVSMAGITSRVRILVGLRRSLVVTDEWRTALLR